MTNVRCFLSITAARDWDLYKMDVHTAFLHGDLEEEVYMNLPPGFRSPTSTTVCQLHKSLYGLKEAPKRLFAKLSSRLLEYGFVTSYADYSFFTL